MEEDRMWPERKEENQNTVIFKESLGEDFKHKGCQQTQVLQRRKRNQSKSLDLVLRSHC